MPMRRFAAILALVMGALVLGGCAWDWSDPVHPRSYNARMTNCR